MHRGVRFWSVVVDYNECKLSKRSLSWKLLYAVRIYSETEAVLMDLKPKQITAGLDRINTNQVPAAHHIPTGAGYQNPMPLPNLDVSISTPNVNF
jgi:hypothetical protein